MVEEQEVEGLQLGEEKLREKKKKTVFVMGFEEWVGHGQEKWSFSRNQGKVSGQLWEWAEKETWD